MEAPDAVESKLLEVVHQVNVEVYEAEDEVEVDIGCDMPMSIYLQPIIVITFVSKLLRSKFPGQFSN
jgi:hypothetical protein